MEDVYTYLENRDGVCQFPLNMLMDQIKGPEKRRSKLIWLKKVWEQKKKDFFSKKEAGSMYGKIEGIQF